MSHDLGHDPDVTGWNDMTRRAKVRTWITHYWWPTRSWMPTIERWWDYHVLRIPKPPPLAEDPVAHHFGFADGIPPCTDGPRCAKHGWELSPLAASSPVSDQGTSQ